MRLKEDGLSGAMNCKIANYEIAVYALNLLGGVDRRISTEDVSLKCFQLAPSAFSWVKYPQYPDKEVVRFALVDARKAKCGALVQGRAGRGTGQQRSSKADPSLDGWALSQAGIKWVRENGERMAAVLGSDQGSAGRQEQRQRLARIRDHRVFHRFLEQPEGFSPLLGELAELFRCRVDADSRTWNKRFSAATNLAQTVEDQAVLTFLKRCRELVESQMSRS